MDYPNDFNIPSFPAGKTIALTRAIAIWILIVFFLIVSACGLILFYHKAKTNYPFLISVDPFTDDWTVIAYPHETQKPKEQYEIIQEKLVNDFVINWFTISSNQQINESRWKKCSVAECADLRQFNPTNIDCAVSCKSSDVLFQEFSKKVLPQYMAMIERAGETWDIKKNILPIMVSENASKWQVHITIKSKTMGIFNVLAFIDIERDINLYPATFGYYVTQFNSYRVEQK